MAWSSVGRRRIPLGVIASIYESRPNVTVDIFGLCFKSGNACILRGGKEALRSNTDPRPAHPARPGRTRARRLERCSSWTIPTGELVEAMLKMNQFIDLIVPRGGDGLVQISSARTRPCRQSREGSASATPMWTGRPTWTWPPNVTLNAKVRRPYNLQRAGHAAGALRHGRGGVAPYRLRV